MENLEKTLGRHVNLLDRNDIGDYLNEQTLSFLSKLDTIWDEIDIDGDDRKTRGFNVIQHVKDLFEGMLTEAKDWKNSLADTITTLLKELSALGKELRIDISSDLEGYETMGLNTIVCILQEKIDKYRIIHAAKLNEIKNLKSKEDEICQKFGRKGQYLSQSPLASSEEINIFKLYVDGLVDEEVKRRETFSKTKAKIIELLEMLDIKVSLNFEKKVLRENESTFSITDENMKQLETWHSSLKCQQIDMQSKISELREKINTFWERLEESPETRSAFLEAHPENNIFTYKALKAEEARCKEKIKTNIKIFIDKMRNEIMQWWETCYYSDTQKKNDFIHFNSDCYTEDLLTLHEIYIDKLKHHFETNKPIYDLLTKRDDLWKRLLELEEKSVNPDRLKNRGGQLLREEKERNSVKAKLPKVEQRLLKLIDEYETKNKKQFLILGHQLTDLIENDWEQIKENRHNQLSAKKQARECIKSSLKSPAARTLLSAMSNVNTPRTPRTLLSAMSHKNTPRILKASPKRKLATPLFGNSLAKKNKQSAKKIIPKIQVNATTINKRVSLERRKRLDRKSRSFGKNKSNAKTPNTTDYDSFEMGLKNKTTSRSTLSEQQVLNNAICRTPSRTNLRSKSPSNLGNRLTPAPGTRPIII